MIRQKRVLDLKEDRQFLKEKMVLVTDKCDVIPLYTNHATQITLATCHGHLSCV